MSQAEDKNVKDPQLKWMAWLWTGPGFQHPPLANMPITLLSLSITAEKKLEEYVFLRLHEKQSPLVTFK